MISGQAHKEKEEDELTKSLIKAKSRERARCDMTCYHMIRSSLSLKETDGVG